MDFLSKSKSINFNPTSISDNRRNFQNAPEGINDMAGGGQKSAVAVQLDYQYYSNDHKTNNKNRKMSKEMMYDACFDGTIGSFNRVKNDFTEIDDKSSRFFQNQPHWTEEECKKVKRFRFVIATLTLMALLLCLTSRTVLNVGIVEMAKSQGPKTENAQPSDTNNNNNFDDESVIVDKENKLLSRKTRSIDANNQQSEEAKGPEGAPEQSEDVSVDENAQEEYTIDWTPKKKNYLISSFYMGYAPSMMLTGGLANKYGGWWPLFLSVFVSFLMNAVTPLITSYSYTLLFISRLVLGIFQGCVMPATYDIFSKWLTMTETSIFAPMVKVSFGLGALIGSALPFITFYFGYGWPYLFYESSFLCFLWSLAWCYLATSTPQENKWVEPDELKRIMRKKLTNNLSTIKNNQTISTIKINNSKNNQLQTNDNCFKLEDLKKLEKTTTKPEEAYKNNDNNISHNNQTGTQKESAPWLLIAFNPSVLALAVTKYTYNLGADFVCLELSLYLDRIHKASMDTISQISSAGFLMQALLSTGVAWLAKYAVQNKSLGLSKTKWRKIFQGFSNFGMSIMYFILAFGDPSYTTIICLLMIVFFLWMFGAGGESIVAYDLSEKYAATITGFAHSIGIVSSVSLPALCDIILQQEDTNNERWKTVFLMIAILTLLGGIVFILFVKPKPFLPGEKVEKRKKLSTT